MPWLHESVKAEVIAAIRLRYTLMPYLWNLFERAQSHHEPIIRPTFYNFPDDEACFADSDDFMLGDALLVAPVVTQGASSREVYLPHGPAAWLDFHSGKRMIPGQRHTVEAPLHLLPLFAPSGASIPVAESRGNNRHDDPVNRVLQFS